MIMSMPALAVAFAALVPLMLFTIWKDVKDMLIPNRVVLAVFAVFLATGSWGLEPMDFVYRILQGVAVFFLAYLIFQLASGSGIVGGGDLKLIAAFSPFVPYEGVSFLIILYVVLSIAMAILFLVLRWILKGHDTGYAAFNQEFSMKVRVPAGVALGLTILIFVGSYVLEAMNGGGGAV